MTSAWFSAAVGWLLFFALTGVVGVVGSRWWLRANTPAARVVQTRLRGWGTGLGLLLLVALVGVLGRQLVEFRDPFVPVGEDLDILLGSAWGSAWLGATVASVVAVLSIQASRFVPRTGWLVATLALLVVCGFPGRTGHANAVEALWPLAWVLDAVHVIAAGLWVGGLGVVWLFLNRPQAWGMESADQVSAAVDSFSRVAQVSVVVLVASGLYAAWTHLPDISALLGSSYGRLLVMKTAAAIVVMGLGWLNWKRNTPVLEATGDVVPLAGTLRRELLFAQVVLLMTALLVRTSPGGSH